MGKLLIVIMLVLTVIIWLLYHKVVTVYYTNMLVGIFRELIVCFFVAGIVVGLIYAGITRVFQPASGAREPAYQSSVSAPKPDSALNGPEQPQFPLFNINSNTGELTGGEYGTNPSVTLIVTGNQITFRVYSNWEYTRRFMEAGGIAPLSNEIPFSTLDSWGNTIEGTISYIDDDTIGIETNIVQGNERSPDIEYTILTRETVPSNNWYEAQNSYLLPTDTQYITPDDLRPFTKEEVVLIRNEIYARYGYTFHTDYISDYFMAQDWYYPNPSVDSSTFNTSNMTEIERKNLETITKYERDMGWKS